MIDFCSLFCNRGHEFFFNFVSPFIEVFPIAQASGWGCCEGGSLDRARSAGTVKREEKKNKNPYKEEHEIIIFWLF